MAEHNTILLFNFLHVSTVLDEVSLWLNPAGSVDIWMESLRGKSYKKSVFLGQVQIMDMPASWSKISHFSIRRDAFIIVFSYESLYFLE